MATLAGQKLAKLEGRRAGWFFGMGQKTNKQTNLVKRGWFGKIQQSDSVNMNGKNAYNNKIKMGKKNKRKGNMSTMWVVQKCRMAAVYSMWSTIAVFVAYGTC